jgi:hypothetical protein
MKAPRNKRWILREHGGQRSMPPSMTDAEAQLVHIVLREARHAAAIGEQLHVLFDPYLAGEGANVHVSYNELGASYDLQGRITKRRRRRPRRPRGAS